MDPKILHLADELLDKYLSYSECELKEISNKDVSPFWKEVCSTVNLTEVYSKDVILNERMNI